MSDVLTEENIELNRSFRDKREAIVAAGRILVENGYVTEQYIESMLERDRDVSVYIGNHLAIPHGMPDSEPHIRKSGISVIQVPGGVQFEDHTAYMIIGIAGKNNSHMDILSAIAVVCMEKENVDRLKNAKSKKEILELLADV